MMKSLSGGSVMMNKIQRKRKNIDKKRRRKNEKIRMNDYIEARQREAIKRAVAKIEEGYDA